LAKDHLELRGTAATLIRELKAGVEVLVELLEVLLLGTLIPVLMVVVVGLMVGAVDSAICIGEPDIEELFALSGQVILVNFPQLV